MIRIYVSVFAQTKRKSRSSLRLRRQQRIAHSGWRTLNIGFTYTLGIYTIFNTECLINTEAGRRCFVVFVNDVYVK